MRIHTAAYNTSKINAGNIGFVGIGVDGGDRTSSLLNRMPVFSRKSRLGW
ncbi:hypothetical protein LWM68_07620 [Niabella sp. W65]|nr:hypothetical protein [Niabella sp. W65]MCH7362648.1 hypothetical protein [Niabella sp. W65]ULT38609.1 hypothetical protein KRR40_26305 [Niabella sp. I65]